MATWNITNCDDNVRPVTPIHEGDCLCNDGKYIFIPPKTGEKTYEIIYNDGKGDPISTLYTVKYSDCLACNCDKFTFTQTVVSIPSEGCESLTIGTIAGECIKNESALGLYVIPDSIIYPDAYDKNFVTATTEFNSDTNTYDVKVNVTPNEHLSYRRFELKFKIVDANNRTIYNCRRTYEFKQIDMCESLTTPPEAVADKTSVPPMGTVEQRTVMIDTGNSECWEATYEFVSPTPANHASFIGANGTNIRIEPNPSDTTITVKAHYVFTNVVNGETGESYVTITQNGGCGCSSITNFRTYNTLGADDTFKLVCDFKLTTGCEISKVAFVLDDNNDRVVSEYGITQNISPSDVWVVTAITNANTETRAKTFTYHLKYNNVDCNWLSGKTTQSFNQCAGETTSPVATADKTSVPSMGTVEQRTVYVDTGSSECWDVVYSFVSPTPENHASFIGGNGTAIRINTNPGDTTITVKAHYVFTNTFNRNLTGESYVAITQEGGCGCSSITNFRTYNTLGVEDTFKLVCDFKLDSSCSIDKVAFVLDDNSDGVVNTYGIVQNTSPSDVWIVTASTNANTDSRAKTFKYHLKYNNTDCSNLSGKTTQSFNQCAGQTTSPIATGDKASVPSMGTAEQRTVYVDTGSSECWSVACSFVSPTPANHASFIGANGTAIRLNTNPDDSTITVKAHYVFTNTFNSNLTGESYVTITQNGGCGCSSITNFRTYNTLGAEDTFKLVCDFKLDSSCSIDKVAFVLDDNSDGVVNTYGIVQNTSPSDVWIVTAVTNANTEERTKTFKYHLKYNNTDCSNLSGKTTQSAAEPTCLCTNTNIAFAPTEQNTYSYLYINDELNVNGTILPFAVISAKTSDCVIDNFNATTTDSRIKNLGFVKINNSVLPQALRDLYSGNSKIFVLTGKTNTSTNTFENTGTFKISISACSTPFTDAIVYYRCECGMDDCYKVYNVDGSQKVFGTYMWIHDEMSTPTATCLNNEASNADSVCVNRLSVMTYDQNGNENGWATLLDGTTTGGTVLPVNYEWTGTLPTTDATKKLKNIYTSSTPLNVGNGMIVYTQNVSIPNTGTLYPYSTVVYYKTTLGNRYAKVDSKGRHYIDLKFKAAVSNGTEYVSTIVGSYRNGSCAIQEFNVRIYIAPPGYRYYRQCGLGTDNVRHCILNSIVDGGTVSTICQTGNYSDNQTQIWNDLGWQPI